MGRSGASYSGTYVAQDDAIYLMAGALGVGFGSPSLTDIGNGWVGWLMTDSTTPFVGGQRVLPTTWTTYKLSALWCAVTANSGDAQLRGDYAKAAIGAANSATSGTARAATAAGQYVLVKTQLETDLANTAGSVIAVKAGRLTSGNTLTGSIGLVALVLEKVS